MAADAAFHLQQAWRGWEAGASSEFLNWFLSTSHGRPTTAEGPVLEDWICFREDQAELDERARAILGERAELLDGEPAIGVVIGGLMVHPGTVGHGMRLGLKRVGAVRSFLLAAGIGPDRIGISVRGSGWTVVERCSRQDGATDHPRQCRLQIIDPLWMIARN